jgi:hypothetical protein
MRLTTIGEDFRLYGVNFKGLFSPTTPPQSTIHMMDLAWLIEPLLTVRISQTLESVNRKIRL